MIKAVFTDFYGTLVHEDGDSVRLIGQEILNTGKADNIDIKCVFENNTTGGRRFVCSYYIGNKFLSPLIIKSMIRIREA